MQSTDQFDHSSTTQLPRRPGVVRSGGNRWTRRLGVASVALGVPAVALAGPVCRIAGLPDDAGERAIVRAVGVRELAAAGGLLGAPHRAWLWARVAGDAIDLTLLGRALAHHRGPGRERTAAVTALVAGITAIDVAAALTARDSGGPVELVASVTVRRPRAEVYEFWRGLQNLPQFMAHLDAVEVLDGRRSHWVATAPFGRTVEWDAEVTDEIDGERLRWASNDGALVDNDGTVVFTDAPAGRGTEIHVTLRYQAPGGDLGRAAARYFGEAPRQQLDDDLRRLKQILETGEVIRSDGAPEGVRARHQFPQHPAQPLSPREVSEGADA